MADEKDEEAVEESSDEEAEDETEVDVSESEESSDDGEEASNTDSEESSEGDGSDEEGSDEDGGDGDASDLVDKMAESDQLEGVSKDAIKDALSEVAGDADGEGLADAVASAAGEDGEEESEGDAEVEVEEEESDDEVDVDDGEESSSDEAEREEPTDDSEAGEDAEADDEDADDEKKESEPSPHAVGDVFDPEANRTGEAASRIADETEFEEFDREEDSNAGVLIAGAVTFVVAAIGIGYLFGFTAQGERLMHLFTGDLEEWELAQARQEAAELRDKQRDVIKDTPKIGNLKMRGTPRYGLVRVDGELQYGSITFEGDDTKYWKRMRLGPKTNFPVFDIDKKHEVTVDSPGYEKRTLTLEKGHWSPVGESVPDLDDAALKYKNEVNVILVPASRAREIEMHERMKKDKENDFYGEISIQTKPEGANIILNGEPLRNEDGEKLKTPVTFDKFYKEKDEEDEEGDDGESGNSEESEGKWKEQKVKVDMPPDAGHSIRLEIPESEGDYPRFATEVNRKMWKCNWKDGEVPEKPHPDKCNYTFDLSVDFNEVKKSIEEREKRRQKIKDAWADAQNKLDKIVESATAAVVEGANDEKTKAKKKTGDGDSQK